MPPVNVVRNVCNYTYNKIPESKQLCSEGIKYGKEQSQLYDYNKFRTFCIKVKETSRYIYKNTNPIDIPVILSAIAIPTTPVFGSPIAFAIGCIIASPTLIKKVKNKEITTQSIRELTKNLTKKDYIPLDKNIKNTIKKANPFTKLNK